MKVVFHEAFRASYCSDPAAAEGRIDSVLNIIRDQVEFVEAQPADLHDIEACHTKAHIDNVSSMGLYDIAALAAGAAIQAATIGLKEPCFALLRPPGHHASPSSAWGYCYFNNMAIAISKLKRTGRIRKAFVLDIDRHFGDGTVNILTVSGYTTVFNPYALDADTYLEKIREKLDEDFDIIGRLVKEASGKRKAGYFAILEGGYNQEILGHNVLALIRGLSD
jgi:acetoin utilization deacetylase AcuC-like enzyme